VKFTETAARHELRVRIGALPALAKDAPIDWPTGMDIEDLLPMCRDAPIDKRSRKIRLYVAVADSGHGMSTEEQEHLFQRFSQASPKTYGEFGGHGLGCESP
jgi:signal transduction histidine kinase